MGKSNALPKLHQQNPTGETASPVSQNHELRSGNGAAPAGAHGTHSSIPDLDRLIHERIRLGIVSALAAATHAMTFNDLKSLLDTTDGNLSVHARKLEEAKYIACTKSFEGRVPKTEYTLTASGRRAFEKYLDHMEAIIQAAKLGDAKRSS